MSFYNKVTIFTKDGYSDSVLWYTVRMVTKAKDTSALDDALRYLGASARTEQEIRDRLRLKEHDDPQIDECIERLKELALVDDAAYADEFVASRLRAKPLSRLQLYKQLCAHKLDKELIQAALDGLDEETEQQNALEFAEKLERQLINYPLEQRRRRIAQRLQTRGFRAESIASALNALGREAEEEL